MKRNIQRKSNFLINDENNNFSIGNLKSNRNIILNDNLNISNINNCKGNDNTFIDSNAKSRYLLSSPENKDGLNEFIGKGNKKYSMNCLINLTESKTKIEKGEI